MSSFFFFLFLPLLASAAKSREQKKGSYKKWKARNLGLQSKGKKSVFSETAQIVVSAGDLGKKAGERGEGEGEGGMPKTGTMARNLDAAKGMDGGFSSKRSRYN